MNDPKKDPGGKIVRVNPPIERECAFKVHFDPDSGLIQGRFAANPRFAEILLNILRIAIADVLPTDEPPPDSSDPWQEPEDIRRPPASTRREPDLPNVHRHWQ